MTMIAFLSLIAIAHCTNIIVPNYFKETSFAEPPPVFTGHLSIYILKEAPYLTDLLLLKAYKDAALTTQINDKRTTLRNVHIKFLLVIIEHPDALEAFLRKYGQLWNMKSARLLTCWVIRNHEFLNRMYLTDKWYKLSMQFVIWHGIRRRKLTVMHNYLGLPLSNKTTYHYNIASFGLVNSYTEQLVRGYTILNFMEGRVIQADSLEDMHRLVAEGKADIAGIATFFNRYDDVYYTVPIRRNDVKIVIRKGRRKTQLEKIFGILHWKIWVLLLVLTTVMVLAIRILENLTTLDLLVAMLSCLLSAPNVRFDSLTPPSKLALFSWLTLSMVITMFYQTGILAAVVSTQYHDNLDSLEQLQSTDLKIVVIEDFTHKIPQEFINRTVLMKSNEVYDHLLSGNTSYGYALMEKSALDIFELLRERNVRNDFHVMKESFIPTYDAFCMMKGTSQYSLTEHTIKDWVLGTAKPEEEVVRFLETVPPTVINIVHVKDILLLMVFGIATSLSVLILEILTFRIKRALGITRL